MKKKYLVTAVAMLATVSMLAACGGKEENKENPTTTPTVTVAPVEDVPADEGEGPQGTQTPSVPTNPTEAPVENTTDHKQVVQDIYQAVVETYGSAYLPDMGVQEDAFFMQDTLKLDASWYDAAIVEVPMMTSNADMFAILHVTEGNLENVKKAFEDYQSYLINDSFQYPMNMPKIQGSVVETLGDEYVMFSILSGLAYVDMEETDEAVLIEAYRESSRVAVDVAAAVISGEMVVEPWTELDKIRNSVVKMYGTTYYPNVKVQDDEAYLSTYLADTLKMDAAWIDEIIIEVPMISANVDTLILVDPSEGNAENVLNALKAYKTYLVEESFQYPMNEARVKSAVVQQVGDYVCFSILGGALDNPEEYGLTTDEDIAAFYEQTNMNAIYAIQGYLGIWE